MKTKVQVSRSLLAASATALLALTTVLPARADYSSSVMSFNPLGYWPLNDNVAIPKDVATNSGTLGATANGVYQAAVTHPVAGALVGSGDTAAHFSGAANVQIPWNAAMNPPAAFTVEAWAKSTAASGTRTIVQSMVQGQNATNSADRTGWNLRESGADLQFLVGAPNGTPSYYYYTVAGVVTPGLWQHIAVVYDGTVPNIYINGVLATSVTVTRNDGVPLTPADITAIRVIPNLLGPTIIGDRGYGGWAFNGDIDEVAIYGTALSAQTLLDHYNNGMSASPAQPYDQLVKSSNPVTYWRLNEPTFVFVPPVAANRGSWGAGGNGAYQSGVTTKVPGPTFPGFGSNSIASYFNNTFSSYVNLPAQQVVVTSLTVTAWIKRDGQSIYWNMVYSHPNAPGQVNPSDPENTAPNSDPVTGIGFNNTSPYNVLDGFYKGDVANTGRYGWAPGSLVVPDQNWMFVAMVVDGSSNMVLYLNGQSVTKNTAYGAHDFSTCDALIGRKQQLYGFVGEISGFKGSIAHVSVFDQALTKNQLTQIYAGAEPPPIILVQPVAPPPPVYEGAPLSLGVVADTGFLPAGYQWLKNGSPLTGQNATNLTINALATTDSGNYAVMVTNAFGAVTSSVVSLTVLTGPPVITQAPQSIQRYAGGTATFKVSAIGSLPLSYQWSFNDTPISGATSSSYTVNDVRSGDVGKYSVLVTNAYGSTNLNATLTLLGATKLAGVVTERSPLGYWRMDETSGTVAYDYQSGLNGTYGAGVTNNVAGPVPTAFQGFDTGNKAYAFNGNGGYVTVPPLGQFAGAMTIVAWIKPNAVQSDYAGLVFTRGGGGSVCGLGFTTQNQIGYTWNNNGATYNFLTGMVPVADQWNFVALVVEPTQATLYMDTGWGIMWVINPLTHGTATWSNVRLGSDPAGGRDYNGSMDDVAVYPYALSPEEIDNIRKAGVEGIYTPAKQYRWNGANGANWSVAGNWNNTVPGVSNVAILSDSSSPGATVNLDTDVTVGGLTFNNKVANQTLASTGGKTLTLAAGSTVKVQGGAHSISANVNSDGTVTSSGVGALTLSGTSNYIGGAFFANGSSLSIPGGATLTVNGERFLANNGIAVALSGVLNVRDWGTIGAAESFPGAPISTMVLKDSARLNLPTSFFIVSDQGLNDGRLTIQDSAELNASMLILGQYGQGARGYVIQNSGTVTLTLSNAASLWYIIPALQIGSSASINWGGTWGNGQGEYHLNGGTLTAHSIGGGGGAQGGSSQFYFNGGTLKPTVSDADVATALAGMTGQGTPAQTVFMQYLTQVVVDQNGAIIDTAGQSISLDQSLLPGSGHGGLTKQGTGILTLLQPSTYTGPTRVEGGTLACATAASLAATPLQIASGATVDLRYSGTRTIPSLTLNGVAKAAGVYGASTAPACFTGTGTVTVLPPVPPTPTLPPGSFTLRAGGVPTFTGVPTEAGWTYYLVYKNNLTDPTWTRITPGTPGGGLKTFTDPTAPLPADRFYRLEVTQ